MDKVSEQASAASANIGLVDSDEKFIPQPFRLCSRERGRPQCDSLDLPFPLPIDYHVLSY
jgi:hypothetical protein